MDSKTLDIIKSTIPLLEMYGDAIVQDFYQQLFLNYPELKHIFNAKNQSSGLQSKALSDAVLAYAKYIDQVEVLAPAVERIAHKHASFGIQPEQYPLVGKTLLASIQKVLNLPDNHEALLAWQQAYDQLAALFIQTEATIYQDNQQKNDGWLGFKPFVIERIEQETAQVKSFYLKSKDGHQVPKFQAGQFIGIRLKSDKSDYQQIRQYSLSDINQNVFRITVKCEHKGLSSNHLHVANVGDVVEVQPPTGVFTLKKQQPKTIFIAGGVGVTPLMSMLKQLLNEKHPAKNLLFIQCAKTSDEQIFKQELSVMRSAHSFIHKICLSEDTSSDKDHQGYLTKEIVSKWIKEFNFSHLNSDVYFCGPQPFMLAVNDIFKALEYDESQLHCEVFGPTVSR